MRTPAVALYSIKCSMIDLWKHGADIDVVIDPALTDGEPTSCLMGASSSHLLVNPRDKIRKRESGCVKTES